MVANSRTPFHYRSEGGPLIFVWPDRPALVDEGWTKRDVGVRVVDQRDGREARALKAASRSTDAERFIKGLQGAHVRYEEIT